MEAPSVRCVSGDHNEVVGIAFFGQFWSVEHEVFEGSITSMRGRCFEGSRSVRREPVDTRGLPSKGAAAFVRQATKIIGGADATVRTRAAYGYRSALVLLGHFPHPYSRDWRPDALLAPRAPVSLGSRAKLVSTVAGIHP
jgi:hypothetical protein